MQIPDRELDRPPPSNTGPVTLLGGCWAFCGACGIFQSLLTTHALVPLLTSFAPLLGGWATLERKRWGRLALLGMSWTILGAGVLGVALVIMVENHYGHHVPRKYAALVTLLMRLYTGNQSDFIRLPLATASGVWLRRSPVAAEFNHNKRKSLAVMQHCIAVALVLAWFVPALRWLPRSAPAEKFARLSPSPEPAREARR